MTQDETTPSERVKAYYRQHADLITLDRQDSEFWIRRWVHLTIHQRFDRHVSAGATVLDAGCGEGHLSARVALRGAHPIAMDLSAENVARTKSRLAESGTSVMAIVGDLERLPFRSSSVDLVVSSHAIEHLPDPDAGVKELARVSRGHMVIAMPTCLTPVALCVLGGDVYWRVTRRTPFAWIIGLVRVVTALLCRHDGPNEGYRGRSDLVHIWRFPWRVTQLLTRNGLLITNVEGGPLAVPYLPEHLPFLRPLQVRADRRLHGTSMFRWLGVGLHVTAHLPEALGGDVPHDPRAQAALPPSA